MFLEVCLGTIYWSTSTRPGPVTFIQHSIRPIRFIFSLSYVYQRIHVNNKQFLLDYFNEMLFTDNYTSCWWSEL